MKLIRELREKDVIGINNPDEKEYSLRFASRAVVFDKEDKIALMFVKKYKNHKLPGGGIEENEDIKKALVREIKEEVGCDIKILKEVGEIIEFKNQYKQKQKSYCFIARLISPKGEVSFTEQEKENGFELLWVNINEAISLLQSDKPDDYTAKFITFRDLIFLQETKKLIK